MIKALFYKEWLKIRWSALIMLALFILTLIKIAMDISYSIRFMNANQYWYSIIFLRAIFYADLTYLPALTGLVVGITQFGPEINSNRLKLTLHLPLAENAILLSMLFFGSLVLLIIFLGVVIILSVIVLSFMPIEVLQSVFKTIPVWFIAGFVVYWAVAVIFVEPIWLKRIFLILFSLTFVDIYLYNYDYNLYAVSIPWFILLAFLWLLPVLYTGYRYRKGVMR